MIAATPEMLTAMMESRWRLARILGATLPAEWPSDELTGALPVYLGQARSGKEPAGWGLWLAVLPQDRAVVGDVGFKGPPNEWGEVEIGYGIAPRFRGRGLATESARGVIEWAFRRGVAAVVAECHTENAASIRVLEKLGMFRTGHDGKMLRWRLEP